jgi:hypothetical protein
LLLTWTNPARNIDGSAATDLSRARILAGGAVLAVDDVSGAGQPDSYTIPASGSIGTVRSFSLQIETTAGKTSDVSNTVSITPVDVPGAVTGLRAIVDQGRITVEWQAPPANPQFADIYQVRRMDSDTAALVNERRWEDSSYQTGETYSYQVLAGRRAGDAVVFGPAAQPVTVRAVDITPPRVPQGIEGVAADTGGFLTWTAGEEADIAGYRIFRSERPDSGFAPVVENIHTNNALFDPGYRPGLYYAVSAVDESGNESARSTPFRVP